MSQKSAASTKTVATGNGVSAHAPALAPANLRKKWQFAADVIGLLAARETLSRRKGPSA